MSFKAVRFSVEDEIARLILAGPAERARSGYPLFATPFLSCLFMTLQFQTKLVPAKPGCCRDSAWLRVSSEIGRQRGLSVG
jgi:hypothetical protein